MIVKGELVLEHEGHHRCVLKEFDQDCFNGSWKTKSFGKVIDFNLMMNDDCTGELDAIHLNQGQRKKVILNSKKGYAESIQAIYCVNGKVVLKAAEGDEIMGNEGDMILVKANGDLGEQYFEVYNNEGRKVDLIIASIFLEKGVSKELV